MEDEKGSGMEQKEDCGGCLVTDSHQKLSDERWDMIVKGVKIGAYIAGIFGCLSLFVFAVASGGLGFILQDINATISQSNVKIDKLTDKISENTTVSATTQQELVLHKEESKKEHDFLKDETAYNRNTIQFNSNHDNEVREVLGIKPVNTAPFRPPQ